MNVEELVSALTLEEKAGLCSGADFWHTKAVSGWASRLSRSAMAPTAAHPKRRQHRPQRCHRGRVLPRRVRGGSILRPGTDPAHGRSLGREAGPAACRFCWGLR